MPCASAFTSTDHGSRAPVASRLSVPQRPPNPPTGASRLVSVSGQPTPENERLTQQKRFNDRLDGMFTKKEVRQNNWSLDRGVTPTVLVVLKGLPVYL